MSKSIFINVPVKDVAAAREFYTQIGFSINQQFSNDQNAFVAIDEQITMMLIAEASFKQNARRDVADTKTVREATFAIQVASREEVDKIVEAALAAGAEKEGEKVEEAEIGMYSRGFSDLDGHKIDILCMAA